MVSARSAASPPAPNPDALTEDTYEALARLAANLAMAHRDNSIDDAISQLVNVTAKMATQLKSL